MRVEGPSRDSPDLYSPMVNPLFFPTVNQQEQIAWPKADINGDNAGQGMHFAEKIQADSDSGDWHLIKEQYNTQIIEPMALEPENGNCWYDRDSQTLHAVLDSQSPTEVAKDGAMMIQASTPGKQLKNIVIHTPYLGGGVGSKDHSVFPFYCIMAALFTDHPVRIANDRYERFQAGLKRHPIKISNQPAINKQGVTLI